MDDSKNEVTSSYMLIETALRLTLWASFLWLEQQVPFIRHIDEDELWNYRYPSHISIIPKLYLYLFIAGVPLIILLFQVIINRKDKDTVPDVMHAFMGITLAYCINGMFTACLKVVIGRPRPNFFLRCFPDGYGTNIDECTGEYEGMMDGRKSFPSGHASFAFTAMIYMMLHLAKIIELRKIRLGRGFIIFGISLLPLSASLIAASRIADYHHHYSDVIAGGILGTIVAVAVHHCYSEINPDKTAKL